MKKIIKKKVSSNAGVNITGCVFKGVEWDKSSVEVIQTVAQGLLNLTELFKAQDIKIETFLKIEGE